MARRTPSSAAFYVWFSADEGVRLARSEFSGLIITFAITSNYIDKLAYGAN